MPAEEVAEQQQAGYSSLRFIADTLTIMRFATAAFIVILGITVGPDALRVAVIATFVGWVTDCIDGPIARSSRGRESWVARVDFAADVSLGYSFFLFVVITGLFPVIPALVLLTAAAVLALARPSRFVIQIVTAPVFALPVALSFYAGWLVGACYCALIVTMVIFRRERLAENAAGAKREATRLKAESA